MTIFLYFLSDKSKDLTLENITFANDAFSRYSDLSKKFFYHNTLSSIFKYKNNNNKFITLTANKIHYPDNDTEYHLIDPSIHILEDALSKRMLQNYESWVKAQKSKNSI